MGLVLFLFFLHVGLKFGQNLGPGWACNVDISDVDFGLNWPALV